MKILAFRKDGGPLSRVRGFFFVEIKRLFSIVLLCFRDGSREAYHSHAFNSVSWLLWGRLDEYREMNGHVRWTRFRPSIRPIVTSRDNFHKVISQGTSVVLSFRGPWADTWRERREDGSEVALTHGRAIVDLIRSGVQK